MTVAVDERVAEVLHWSDCRDLGLYRSLVEALVALEVARRSATWTAGKLALAYCPNGRGYHLLIGSERAQYAAGEKRRMF